jgi:hypothetical protein
MASLSGRQIHHSGEHYLRLQPNRAKALVFVLGVLVFVADMVVPGDVNIAIFYCFVIVLCKWTRSLAFLWGTVIIFGAAILPGLLLSPKPLTGTPSWVDWVSRLFAMAALVLVAGLLHLRIRNVRLVESRNQELHTALDEIKTLRGILLICSYCKKIEANPETWVDLENYVRRHSDAEFNHGVCPDCLRREMGRVA